MLTALILAGGMGTRLQTAVPDRQKVAAEVAGTPFILRLLRQIEQAGGRRVILCAGYRAESLISALRGASLSLDLKFSIEDRPLGTAGALRLALKQASDPEFLVMNGDSYFEVDLNAFLSFARRSAAPAAICLRRMEDVSRYGRVSLAPDGMVSRFEEKGSFRGAGLINAGIYCFRREVLERIPEKTVCSLEKELFPSLAQNRELAAFPADGTFIDIGTPESFQTAQQLFKTDCQK